MNRFVRKANDDSLEVLIFLARWSSVLMAAWTVLLIMAAILTGHWRYLALAGSAAVCAGSVGWFGWWLHGNAAWRQSVQVERMCGVTYQDRTCTQYGPHEWHWDKQNDPDARRRWA